MAEEEKTQERVEPGHSNEVASPKFFSDDIRERQRKQRNLAPIWPTLSFLLHLLGFALLVIFTPLRELVIEEKKPEPSRLSQASAEELEEIDEMVEAARENEIAQYLMELQTILHNMEFMKNELLKSFDEFAKQEAVEVKSEMQQLFDKVLEKQTTSAELQTKIEQVIDEVIEQEKQDISLAAAEVVQKIADSEKPLKEVEDSQAIAQNLLDVIVTKAQITEMKKTAEATEVARKAQLEINDLQAESRQKLMELKSNNEYQITLKKNISEADKKIEEFHKQDVATAEQKVAEKTEELKAQEEALVEAEKVNKEIAQNKEATHQEKKDAQHNVNKARGQRDKVKREFEQAKRSLAGKEKALENTVNHKNNKANELSKVEKEAKEKTARLEEIDNKVSNSQKELIERVKEIAKIAENEEPKPEPKADENMKSPELANINLSYISLADAYEKAKELEQQIAEKNRDIKATELAINQQMSLQMAENITDVAKTERPEFNKEVLNLKPKTEKEFVEKREEMTKVVRETEDILVKAMSVMNEAMALIEPQQHGAEFAETEEERLKRMNDLAEIQNEIAEAGAEDAQEKSKDLAELMRQADALALNEKLPEESHDMEEKGKENRAFSAPTASSGVQGIAKLETGMPGLEPGNIFGSGGVDAVWGFVNNWYVIGPFDNPNRVNLTRKFAPESVVDLDATYIGKGGKVISWEYVQATATVQNNPWQPSTAKKSMVCPPSSGEYEIWYAYTEIFMEEECDIWIGLGSDDRSDVWINDFKVWSSSDQLKAWRIDEGFRRVHLRKGRNKILARVENGHWNFGWSLCLAPDAPTN
jgi:hypothetical protein